jgi:group I intron endonuclease
MTDESIMPNLSLSTNRKVLSGIYKIRSPSNKIYIGQSVDIAFRFHKYKTLNCHGQPKLFASFRKYGFESHSFEILQLCNVEELNQLEKYYIDLFGTFNSKYGLNLKDGGGSKGRLSEASKQKIIAKLKGKKGNRKGSKHSLEARKKMSISQLSKKRIPWNKGVKKCFSKEVRLKMSISLRNNKNARRAPTYQYSINYKLIHAYSSIAEASRISRISRTAIINNIKNRTKTSGGFIWRNSRITH